MDLPDCNSNPPEISSDRLTIEERRKQPDRRQRPTSPWNAFSPRGRRMQNRRAEDRREPYFVDRFSSITFTLILLLVIASLVDAVLTIRLIEAGAEEVNPLMDMAINNGVTVFLVVKYLLTVSGLPLLLIFKNHYLFKTNLRIGYFIPVAVLLYMVLICYQLTLMHNYMV